MAELKPISSFDTGNLGEDTIFIAADRNNSSSTGYSNCKYTISDFSKAFSKNYSYDTLNTNAKNIIDAINEVNVLSNNYVLTSTLYAGETSISFIDNHIHENSLIDVYLDKYGISANSIIANEGYVTLTFDAQQSDLGVKIILKGIENGGSSGETIPFFSETILCNNPEKAASFTLSEDYNNYDIIQLYLDVNSEEYIITTLPEILDNIFQYSTQVCLNCAQTNIYVNYAKNDLTWTRTYINAANCVKIVGLNCTNGFVNKFLVQNRQEISGSEVPLTLTDPYSFFKFDYIFFSSCSGTDKTATTPMSNPISLKNYPFTQYRLSIQKQNNNTQRKVTAQNIEGFSYFCVYGVNIVVN